MTSALALALWALYGVMTLGLRVAIHLRRTGSTGVVGIQGRPGSAQWFGEVGNVAWVVLGVSAPLMDMGGAITTVDALDVTALHVGGTALFAIGLVGVVAAQESMKASWRIGVDESERTELVTGGIFELVRNPIYTALFITLLGLVLLVPSPVSFAALAVQFVALQVHTRLAEEPYLLRVHGDAYAGYASRVGRFIPGIGKLDR